ncbi:diguanylate cyclase domain-containing protein [Marinicella sediminis]|uniref:diguanylate cyclase n=1 Tax=Marinicella sediminis TaxID=1792834 RepID=A0ABV7JFJ8_9GAMM|nr:tetratricopeptide repeat-containing diguanylate cyclase [Marinicella sediminis]
MRAHLSFTQFLITRLCFLSVLFATPAYSKPPTELLDIDELIYQEQSEALLQIEQRRRMEPDELTSIWLSVLEAKTLYHQNRFADSQSLLINAESASEELNEPELKEMILRLMGQNFYRMGGFDQAMNHALKAQLIAEQHQLGWEQAQLTNLIAAIHLRSGNHQLALKYFKQALAYFTSVNAKIDVAKLNNNLGAVYIETKQFTEASRHLEHALVLAVELDRPTTLVSALVNKIELFVNQQLYDQAISTYQTCLSHAAETRLSSFEVWCLEAGAELFQRQGRYLQAIEVANRAYQMAGEQQLHQSQINLGKLLVSLYSETQQFQQALDISAANLDQVESIKDQVLKLKLEEVRALNDVAKTQAQLRFERQQNNLLEQNQRLTWTGIIILLPMLALALFLLKIKQRLLKDLNTQQLETHNALNAMKEAKDLNEKLARTDPLTGLLNRRAMTRILDDLALDFTHHHLLMIDVDDFKKINDHRGHSTGDEVLTSLSNTLKQQLGEHALAARWGGEEFLVLLGPCDRSAAKSIAEELRKTVANQQIGNPAMSITISLGLCHGTTGDGIDQWIHRADQALYCSKNSGKNCLSVSP